MINIILAVDKNYCIGKDNSLCWTLKSDMKFFSDKTKGNVVIMGKNTYLSLPEKFRPLPNRINIVLSSSLEEKRENLYIFKNLDEAIEFGKEFGKDIYIIGGKKLYEESINYVDNVYITKVLGDFDCNVCLDKSFSLNLSSDFVLNEVIGEFKENNIEFRIEHWFRK